MSKTPYEIRLDVLQMATDLLRQEYDMKSRTFENLIASDVSINASNYETVAKPLEPSAVTSAEIVSKANELYSFVNDNTTRSANTATRSLLTEKKK